MADVVVYGYGQRPFLRRHSTEGSLVVAAHSAERAYDVGVKPVERHQDPRQGRSSLKWLPDLNINAAHVPCAGKVVVEGRPGVLPDGEPSVLEAVIFWLQNQCSKCNFFSFFF